MNITVLNADEMPPHELLEIHADDLYIIITRDHIQMALALAHCCTTLCFVPDEQRARDLFGQLLI